MSKNQETRNQFCTQTSVNTWKSTNKCVEHDKQVLKIIASEMSKLSLQN